MAEGTDPMKDWVLIISQRGQSSHTVPFATEMVFGRSSSCSCVLSDATVSGSHARITEKGGQVVVEDLGSENKTHISGGPSLSEGQTYVLTPGTVIQMGRTFVELRGPAKTPRTAMVDPPSSATQEVPGSAGETTAASKSPIDDAMMTQAGIQVDAEATLLRPDVPPVPQAKPAPPSPPPAPAPAPPPAPPPEPQEAQNTQEAQPSPPASATSDPADSEYLGTVDFGAGGGSGLHAKLAAEGSLQAARARLVVAGQMDRRTDPITTATFSIGRARESQCRLAHPAISTPHATITFKASESRFFIQDEGSRNHTYLAGQLLAAGVQQEIKSNAHLRFGPVDALFVVEIDPDGVKIPEKRQKLAAQLLVENGTITAAGEVSAAKMAIATDQQLGETLLLSPEPLTVKQWVDALEQAKYLEISGGLRGQQRRVWMVAGVVLLLVALVLIIISQL